MSVKVIEEITGSRRDSVVSLLTLHANISEDEPHLRLVVLGQVLPELDNDWFEVTVNVVSLRSGDDYNRFLVFIVPNGTQSRCIFPSFRCGVSVCPCWWLFSSIICRLFTRFIKAGDGTWLPLAEISSCIKLIFLAN